MHRVLSLGVGIFLAATSAGAQERQPFEGRWDCEVATFTFTARSYNNGSETMPIRKLTREGANYRLDFADGYAISLRLTAPDRMQWFSFTSGDRFTCKRLR